MIPRIAAGLILLAAIIVGVIIGLKHGLTEGLLIGFVVWAFLGGIDLIVIRFFKRG